MTLLHQVNFRLLSVREFVEEAFKHVGKEKETGIVRVKVNTKYFRPAEVEILLGDASFHLDLLYSFPIIKLE
uniref:Uncharacterized protein n=1 Tax=Tetranychus urticae TaxID=32264 RepID=T1KJI7_TETUR